MPIEAQVYKQSRILLFTLRYAFTRPRAVDAESLQGHQEFGVDGPDTPVEKHRLESKN